MPPDRDLVLAEVAAIDRCLRRIEQVTGKAAGRVCARPCGHHADLDAPRPWWVP